MRWFWLCLTLFLIQGCTTYKENIVEGLDLAKKGDWVAAEKPLAQALDNSQDQLLYYLELGTLAHNQKNFTRSNTLLEKAERLSDTFFKKSFRNRSWALISNPRQGNYYGNGLERVYISYLKSLNYLALSEQAESHSQKIQLKDAALVEVRRIDIKLNEIQAQTPSYQDIEDKENQAFYLKALRWLSGFYTSGIDRDKYLYREDAWGRYMEGLQYEVSGDYDNARISYQKSAELYDAGFAKQYFLSKETGERAWLDTIRMMQKGGFNNDEIDKKIELKLSTKMQGILQQYQSNRSEFIVLEHEGFMPHKDEMTLLLHDDPETYSLVLEPIYNKKRHKENDAFRWFSMVYADINPLNVIVNYKTGGSWGAISGLSSKRIPLGRTVWESLEDSNISDLLEQQSIRVTIPYYKRFHLSDESGLLSLNTDLQHNSLRMSSLADIAVQDQLAQSQRDIYEALTRELFRSWLTYKLANSIDDNGTGALLGLVGQVAIFASSAADTRNWLTLPAQIRLTRLPTAPGHFTPTYQVGNKTFSHQRVELEENQIRIWALRNPNKFEYTQ